MNIENKFQLFDLSLKTLKIFIMLNNNQVLSKLHYIFEEEIQQEKFKSQQSSLIEDLDNIQRVLKSGTARVWIRIEGFCLPAGQTLSFYEFKLNYLTNYAIITSHLYLEFVEETFLAWNRSYLLILNRDNRFRFYSFNTQQVNFIRKRNIKMVQSISIEGYTQVWLYVNMKSNVYVIMSNNESTC